MSEKELKDILDYCKFKGTSLFKAYWEYEIREQLDGEIVSDDVISDLTDKLINNDMFFGDIYDSLNYFVSKKLGLNGDDDD